jgi:hypothetical protein
MGQSNIEMVFVFTLFHDGLCTILKTGRGAKSYLRNWSRNVPPLYT